MRALTDSLAEEFEPVTFGAGGRFSRHDIDKTSALLDVDDVERYAQPTRPPSGAEPAGNAASTARTSRR